MPNDAIIFSGDDDNNKVFCDDCDALLHERKDGSLICTNCCREYVPGSINKRKRALGPIESPYDDIAADIPLVSMTEYHQQQRKKKPSILDKEERAFVAGKSGRSITSMEEWLPEDEHR
jgi:uncharacterized Zn finger protein (UPF0148 family)